MQRKNIISNVSVRDAARIIGRLGGLKGGKERWKNISSEQRSAYGRMMVAAKHAKKNVSDQN